MSARKPPRRASADTPSPGGKTDADLRAPAASTANATKHRKGDRGFTLDAGVAAEGERSAESSGGSGIVSGYSSSASASERSSSVTTPSESELSAAAAARKKIWRVSNSSGESGKSGAEDRSGSLSDLDLGFSSSNAESESDASYIEPASPRPSMYTAAVAVVDDSKMVQLILLKRLHSLGLSAIECNNGSEILERIKRGEMFRLILMDKSMPVMDGKEVRCTLLRSSFFVLRSSFFVLLYSSLFFFVLVLLSSFFCLLSSVFCLLSSVFCLLSFC
jgi:hypothetical protein